MQAGKLQTIEYLTFTGNVRAIAHPLHIILNACLGARHNNSHYYVGKQAYAKTKKCHGKNYPYHGRVNIQVFANAAANAKQHFVS